MPLIVPSPRGGGMVRHPQRCTNTKQAEPSAAEVELVAGEAIEAHLLGPDGQPLEAAS